MNDKEMSQYPRSQTEHATSYQTLNYEEEINLYDLWLIVYKCKLKIFLIAACITIGALCYAFLAPSVYKAQAMFLPPSLHDIHALNVQGVQGVQDVTVSSVYGLFRRNLGSRALQKQFFVDSWVQERMREKAGGDVEDQMLFEKFQELLLVEADKKNKDYLAFSVFWDKPDMAAQLTNEFSERVERATIEQLIEDVRTSINIRISAVENEIDSKRKLAQQRRFDRIAELEEALKTARQLNIIEPVDLPAQVVSNTTLSGTSVNTESTPLFYRGSRVLGAEIDTLRNRSSDDSFIPGLRDLQEELARLRAVELDPAELQAAKFDQVAYSPTNREKPKRKLIVLLGVVLGLMAGVVAAFFLNFLQKAREQSRERA